MQRKPLSYTLATLGLLVFLFLAFMVKFNPEALNGFDRTIQTAVRGDLPQTLTTFFTMVTVVGNTSTQAVIAIITVIFLAYRKHKQDAIFLAGNSLLAAFCIITIKNIFQRPRPSILHLVQADGYSFPSGHSMGTMLIIGSIIVILCGRVNQKGWRCLIAVALAALIFCVGLSRIYVGVHYPSDVLAGFSLGFGLLNVTNVIYQNRIYKS